MVSKLRSREVNSSCEAEDNEKMKMKFEDLFFISVSFIHTPLIIKVLSENLPKNFLTNGLNFVEGFRNNGSIGRAREY